MSRLEGRNLYEDYAVWVSFMIISEGYLAIQLPGGIREVPNF